MSVNTKLVLFLFVLMALVFVVYLLVVKAYYWGGRGKPPLTGEEKQQKREEELRLRAKQIERAANNPILPRRQSFWDNRKVTKKDD